MQYLRGIDYFYIIGDNNQSEFLFDTVSCDEALLWYGLWSRIGVNLRYALGSSKSNTQIKFSISVAPGEYDMIKKVFECEQARAQYNMVKFSEKKRMKKSLDMTYVNDIGEFHVLQNPRFIFEKMISTTQFTSVLLGFIGYYSLWNFKPNRTLPVRAGNNVHAHGGLSVRRVLHGWETNTPSFLKYNCNEQTLSITVNITLTKADNAVLFISRVRGDISEQRQEVLDDTFVAGIFVHETTNPTLVVIVCRVVEVKTVDGKFRNSAPTSRMIEGFDAFDNITPIVINILPTLNIVAPMWGLFGGETSTDSIGHHYSRRLYINSSLISQSSKATNSILGIVKMCSWNTAGELRELLFERLLASSQLYALPDIQRAQDLLIGISRPVFESLSLISYRDYVNAFVANIIETMTVVLGSKLPIDGVKRLKRKRKEDCYSIEM